MMHAMMSVVYVLNGGDMSLPFNLDDIPEVCANRLGHLVHTDALQVLISVFYCASVESIKTSTEIRFKLTKCLADTM